MDQNLLIVLTIMTSISAIALCIQAGMLIGIYRASKAAQEKVVAVVPKVERFLETSQETLDTSRKQILEVKSQILEITGKANQILDTTKVQIAKVDDLLTDATTRARFQMDRAELVLDDAMTRAQETVAVVHGGVMRPLREVQGVAAGLRTAFQVFVRGNRPSVATATQDEEMFI